ncbi:MAG: amidohydrolase family protein [Planctomycetota bacterium]|nr:amidohydrolase family protein [Planctomycetota bacterium]
MMQTTSGNYCAPVTSAIAGLIVGLMISSPASSQLVIRGDIVHTMAGPPIKDGVVVIRNGKIESVGPAADARIPPEARTLTAKVVTPGLIDAHTVVGLTGYLNQRQDQDQLEHSEAMQPELRAIDAYNGKDRLVDWVRGFGITTIHTGHAPGEVISGQTMIVKTVGNSVEENVLAPIAMVAVTLGEGAIKGGRRAWFRSGEETRKSPGTRSKVAALLRGELIRAGDYVRKRASADAEKRPDRDLRLEVLARVLKGELPLLVTAHRAHDIVTALRLAKEFGVRLVLDGAAESYLVIEEIKAAGVPVIVHPSMARARGELENLSFETAATLLRAGIPVAMQSGYESYVPKTRVVLFETAIAAANGLSFEQALGAITIDAARILGIDGRVGSLEVGKDADLALYDGDPFEYTSHCVGVIINGEVVEEEAR